MHCPMWLLACLLLLPALTVAQPKLHPKLAGAKARYAAAEARHDTLAMVEAAYDMGKHYRASGDFVAGRQWLLYVLRYHETRGPSVALNKVLIQMAIEHSVIGNYPEAFTFAYRALSNSRRLGHRHSLMSSYAMLGSLHYELTQQQSDLPATKRTLHLDSAAHHWQQAEAIALRLNVPLDIAASRYARARLLIGPDPQAAIPLLGQALRIYLTLPQSQNVVSLHTDLADCHTRLGQLPIALRHLRQADSATRYGDFVSVYAQQHTQQAWAEWYRAAGQWPKAYTYLHRADSMRQAMLPDKQRALMAQLNATYEADRREALLRQQQAELALNDARMATQRTYTYLSLGGLLLAAMVGGLYYRLSRRLRRISEQNAHLVREQNHRMKNNLQTVAGLLSLQAGRVTDADAKRVMEESQLRLQTMALLNRKLYETGHMVSADLALIMPDVVSLILNSYGYGALRPTYQIEPLTLSADQLVPLVLILNELTTNACKYAFPDHPDPQLWVRCWHEEGRFRLQVRDNGPGFEPLGTSSDTFGMRLIALQTQQLWGESRFSREPGGGLRFELSAPLRMV
jgi:two-component system, sensor histidine kinase PdtaS